MCCNLLVSARKCMMQPRAPAIRPLQRTAGCCPLPGRRWRRFACWVRPRYNMAIDCVKDDWDFRTDEAKLEQGKAMLPCLLNRAQVRGQ